MMNPDINIQITLWCSTHLESENKKLRVVYLVIIIIVPSSSIGG